jgi:NAD(P)-dependent dehydrogenase (short-subunit alcohol dehydrogenase family)
MSSRPVAFITGASRGIGRGIALELARSGFDIVGNATKYDQQNRESGLGEVRERVMELGVDFEPAPGDIADLSAHETLLSTTLERFGRVDVMVNNAGIAPRKRRDVLETTPESFDEVLAVNTRGTFFLTQRFARHMAEQSVVKSSVAPTIVFVSSISASVSSPSRAEYCISKAAISHAATIFADRLAEFGINVFEVRPGIIDTDMTAPVREHYDARIAEGLVPQKRWGRPDDVGKAVASLVRGDFGYATGLVLELSGGMNIRHL